MTRLPPLPAFPLLARNLRPALPTSGTEDDSIHDAGEGKGFRDTVQDVDRTESGNLGIHAGSSDAHME